MLHDKIESAAFITVEPTELRLPVFRREIPTNGFLHIPRKNGEEDCSCLAGFYRLLIWATRNNGQ